MGAEWEVTEEEIAALTKVEYKRTSSGAAQAAEDIIARSAIDAAHSLVSLAINASNERTRLAASQYIIDRTCGKVGEAKDNSKINPLDELVMGVIREPSAAERATRKQ